MLGATPGAQIPEWVPTSCNHDFQLAMEYVWVVFFGGYPITLREYIYGWYSWTLDLQYSELFTIIEILINQFYGKFSKK